jgi:hypothetical protein
MEGHFTLRGQLLDHRGVGTAGVFVAVVDEDLLDEDDLIGLGKADDEGRFSITFTKAEFEQDFMEMEWHPDIKIVASVMVDDALVAVYEKRFPGLSWSARAADLGEVRLDGVAPIVEQLTGWRGLLDGLKVEVADSLAPTMLRESFAQAGTDPDSWEAKLSSFFLDFAQGPGAGCALYDPYIHTLVINRTLMEQTNLGASRSSAAMSWSMSGSTSTPRASPSTAATSSTASAASMRRSTSTS